MKSIVIVLIGAVVAVVHLAESRPVKQQQQEQPKNYKYRIDHSSGDDDEKGYHKTFSDEGANGYKHYDSFVKKAGDKYGYATRSVLGKKAASVAVGSDKASSRGQGVKDASGQPTVHYEVFEEEDAHSESDNGAHDGDSLGHYETDADAGYGSYDNGSDADDEDNGQYTHEEANSGDDDNYEAFDDHYTDDEKESYAAYDDDVDDDDDE